ncbi:MAG: Hsp70 family protein [Planctomycetales bacterium]
MGRIVGIDLGTTYSAVGYLSADGPRLIPNAIGDLLTPSAVGIDTDGKVLVGRPAKEFQVVQPERCVSTFKRHMGTDWTAEIAGRRYSPEELSSLVLRTLKGDAEAHLGETVDRAVITVPAYFNEHQRKATLRAGRIAGFEVERILNEPTAAAIAYGLHDGRQEKVLVVFDLGGGTFDVSVVDLFEGTLEVRASSGETFLGGEDFTNAMAARIVESRGYVFERAETEHPRLISRLRLECEQAKLRLSSRPETAVRFPDKKGEFDADSPLVAVTRAQFESWTEHILNRMELPIRRALGDAGLGRDDVDELILVGGATRMPFVAERVTQLFGRSPTCRLNPDEVVALGAAVQSGLIEKNAAVEDLVVTDVSPFTLGIEISPDIGGIKRRGYFLPIINRNTTIPVSRVERVLTTAPNMASVRIAVYQGEGRRVASNLFLGEFTVDGIPLGPVGRPIDVRFTYDLNGVLEVEAVVVETRKKVTHVITRHAREMSEADVAKAVAAMHALKTHPREETVNRFLLRRAERVYQELPLPLRRLLEQLILGFEEALEIRDPAVIQRHKASLQEFLTLHDRGTTDGRDSENEGADDDPH